ncbi:hypothetical protein [Candidatus Electronema sp. PJ]|uniref:hypothetical protein n=1 Tax=Candidatus Electronema sp. PJ TaxID=3401572 RepID=UPI003AA923A7
MPTIQWRPAVNALTVPQSYKIVHVPKNTAGYSEIAADLAAANPSWNAEMVEAILRAMPKAIQARLLNGEQVTFEDAFTYRVSFLGKLDAPDDPLPDRDDLIQINVHVSAAFMREFRHAAQLERLAPTQKLPLIAAAEDTRCKLHDVLNPKGVLKLTGSNLFFEEDVEGCGCVIEGTRSGRTVQSQFALISNTSVLLVPDIPIQEASWNNEYKVSITTQYTEHGLLRTGVYERKLRSPLTLFGQGNEGILTDNAASPYVTVTSAIINADEMLRIQAILDIHADHLLFNLIDMEEGGKAGPVVTVTDKGVYTLQGFADSAVSSLEIRVDNYLDLVKMIRNMYSSRVVDILDMKTT